MAKTAPTDRAIREEINTLMWTIEKERMDRNKSIDHINNRITKLHEEINELPELIHSRIMDKLAPYIDKQMQYGMELYIKTITSCVSDYLSNDEFKLSPNELTITRTSSSEYTLSSEIKNKYNATLQSFFNANSKNKIRPNPDFFPKKL